MAWCSLLRTLLLGGALVVLGTLAAAAEEVRFVVFGDTQLGRPAQFERMVHEAELLRPQFYLHTGDMIHGYTDNEAQIRAEWRRFKKQVEPLTAPFYPVPGNHDVGTPEGQRIYGEIWGADRYYYSFDEGTVRCIVLATYLDDTKDRVAPEQLEWLKADLEAYAEAHGGLGSEELERRSIFVFTHSPFWRYGPDEQAGIDDWEEVHAVLRDYPVRMVIGGNTDREHEYVWEERDGIDYVLIASSASMPQENERAGYFHGFLHISVLDGDVRTAVVTPGSILPMDTVNPEEHDKVKRYGLRGGTLRIAAWEVGEPLEERVRVPIENALDHPRTFKLRWEVPRDSGVTVTPHAKWIDVEAGETAEAEFVLASDAAPERDAKPTLHVESTETLRSGVVSREWEARYRDEFDRAAAGEDLETTSVRLRKDYTFDAQFSLYVPPRAVAVRREGEIRLDGVLDESAWERAEPIVDFRKGNDERPATHGTVVRILYDDDYLYVGAVMEEPNPEGLKADAGGEIALTWNDDDFELFFDPTRAAIDHTRIFENAAGTRFTSKPLRHPDRYARMDHESAIHIGADHWSIELRIPWSDIAEAEPPQEGSVWSINVWRHRQQSDPARSYWAVNAYDQGRYGFLEFQ